MKNIKPCPYCGGEVEVVKLKNDKKKRPQYRIECRNCRQLVAKGLKFEKETDQEGKERIKQYEEVISKRMYPVFMQRIRQSDDAKKRDRQRDYGYLEEQMTH